jgi:hypothetical protein
MDHDVAFGRLWNHANMPGTRCGNFSAEEGFLHNLYRSTDTKTPFIITPFVSDIIACLEYVNVHVNGSPPSENSTKRGPIDRELSLATAEIIHAAWQHHWLWEYKNLFQRKDMDELARAAWSISCAWTLLLHGDIDSISEDVGWAYMALETRDSETQ